MIDNGTELGELAAMSSEFKKHLKDFERQLDAALDALPSRQWASTSALQIASELYEIGAFKKGVDIADFVDRA